MLQNGCGQWHQKQPACKAKVMSALCVLPAAYSDFKWLSTVVFEVWALAPPRNARLRTTQLFIFGDDALAECGGEILEVIDEHDSPWQGWRHYTVKDEPSLKPRWPACQTACTATYTSYVPHPFKKEDDALSDWCAAAVESYCMTEASEDTSGMHAASMCRAVPSSSPCRSSVCPIVAPPQRNACIRACAKSRASPLQATPPTVPMPSSPPASPRQRQVNLQCGDLFLAEIYEDPGRIIVRVFWDDRDFDEAEMHLIMRWPALARPLEDASRAAMVTQALAPLQSKLERPVANSVYGYAMKAVDAVAVMALVVPAHDRILRHAADR